MENIQKIEAKYNVSFPKDYLAFITEIGNGGTLEDNGDIISIQPFMEYETSEYTYKGVEQPFSLKRSWISDFGDCIEGDEELDDILDEDVIEQHRIEQWGIICNCGSIAITPTQQDEDWILIVTGPCKGEMWLRSDMGVQRGIHCNFIKWLQLYLKKGRTGLYDFLRECRDIEYPVNPDPKEQCFDFIKKQKIIMNPPLSGYCA